MPSPLSVSLLSSKHIILLPVFHHNSSVSKKVTFPCQGYHHDLDTQSYLWTLFFREIVPLVIFSPSFSVVYILDFLALIQPSPNLLPTLHKPNVSLPSFLALTLLLIPCKLAFTLQSIKAIETAVIIVSKDLIMSRFTAFVSAHLSWPRYTLPTIDHFAAWPSLGEMLLPWIFLFPLWLFWISLSD